MTANKETEEKSAAVGEAIKKLKDARQLIDDAASLYLDEALIQLQSADELIYDNTHTDTPNLSEILAWIGNIDYDNAIEQIDWVISHLEKYSI